MKPTIAVDFDGTLVDTDEEGLVSPVQGAKESIKALRENGYRVIIYTCRTGIAHMQERLDEEIHFITETLHEFGIEFDDIFIGEKLVADLYVDNRGVPFRGNWKAVEEDVESLLGKV